MKNFKLILNVLVVVTSFMFFQCTSDYTPIPGPAGADGAQGLDGADGVDGAEVGSQLAAAREKLLSEGADSPHRTALQEEIDYLEALRSAISA